MSRVAHQLAIGLGRFASRLLLIIAVLLALHSSATAQTPTVTVQFDNSSYTVNESDGTVTLTVTLSGAVSGDVTVNYATSAGTALAGIDYTAASGVVAFPQGITSRTVNVGIIDNDYYTSQPVSFTVVLSNPANAALGTPSTATVSILDDDPAPTCMIGMAGVANGDKNNPGGYVSVNANNDNGSALTYSDGKTAVPQGSYGIPTKRDIDVEPMPFGPDGKTRIEDKDLLQITIATTGLKVGGPEKVVLSVASIANARSTVLFFEDKSKSKGVSLPATWQAKAVGGVPASVYLEGRLESASLKERSLTLQIQNADGTVVATDTCVFTVTPVLTNLVVTTAAGSAPDLTNTPGIGLLIDSASGGGGKEAFTLNASAQWDKVPGKLKFIQTVQNVNNLKIGNVAGWGADKGPRKYDFAAPNSGMSLVDGTPIPFYARLENANDPAQNGGVATLSNDDSPALGPNDVNSILPAVGGNTNVDVTFSYVTHAAVAFDDKSIYCLGQQSWNVRFHGNFAAPNANLIGWAKGANNKNNPSAPFGAGVRNNANPAAIGPTNANNGGSGWR